MLMGVNWDWTLQMRNIEFNASEGTAALRKHLKNYVCGKGRNRKIEPMQKQKIEPERNEDEGTSWKCCVLTGPH
jgi:hypothetical protein